MTDYVAFFCNFGVEYNFDVMRTFRFLLLSACCGWSVVTFAQRYELEEVKAGRYEVTNRLDAGPIAVRCAWWLPTVMPWTV